MNYYRFLESRKGLRAFIDRNFNPGDLRHLVLKYEFEEEEEEIVNVIVQCDDQRLLTKFHHSYPLTDSNAEIDPEKDYGYFGNKDLFIQC
jgi:hypothetical protein